MRVEHGEVQLNVVCGEGFPGRFSVFGGILTQSSGVCLIIGWNELLTYTQIGKETYHVVLDPVHFAGGCLIDSVMVGVYDL